MTGPQPDPGGTPQNPGQGGPTPVPTRTSPRASWWRRWWRWLTGA